MKLRMLFTAVAACFMAGNALAQDLSLLEYRVPSMHCEHCAARVRNAIDQRDGVDRVNIDLEKQVVSIKYDASKITPETISAALTEARYEPTSYSPTDVIAKSVAYRAEDMHCSNCAKRVQANFDGIEGISSVETDVDNHAVTINYDANKVSSDTFKDLFRQLDYTVSAYYTSEVAKYVRFNVVEGALDEDAEINLYDEVEGVADVTLNEKTKVMAITYDTRTLADEAAVKQAIEEQGYKLEAVAPHKACDLK